MRFDAGAALVQTFTVDAANELTGISRSGSFTLSGATPAPAASVTVNGQSAQTYGDFTFASAGISLADGNNTFTNIAQNIYGVKVTNIFTVNLPATVTPLYDADGNLTNDGVHSLAYDKENELTNVTVAGQFKKDFVYDGLRRLRVKKEYAWTGSSWTETNETRYIWDGNDIVQLRDSNNVPVLTLTRGLDMSGSSQGAGGIGGLLAMTDGSGANYYYHSDGNGNVTALMDAQENIVARRMYDAFGRTINLTGSKAGLNPFWFASQLHDDSLGVDIYRYRTLLHGIQRWSSPDPAGLAGGINPFGFVANNPLLYVDPYGLAFGDYWDINATANYYNQVSANGLSQGGFAGYFKFIGGQLGEDVMDLFGAGSVQNSAQKSGAASTDQCHEGAAWGYGALTAATIGLNAIPGEGKVADEGLNYSERVLQRMAEEPGTHHNFPFSFDNTIINQGEKNVISDHYTQYELKGSINDQFGTYQIGINNSGQITHRFFAPDK